MRHCLPSKNKRKCKRGLYPLVQTSFRLSGLHILQASVLFISGNTADFIFLIHENNLRRIHSRLLRCHLAIAHQNDFIALLHTARRRTVQANHTAACFACDGVGFKAFPVVDIYNLHLFVFQNAGSIQKILIDRDLADVIQLGLHDGRAVNLTLEHIQHHFAQSSVRKLSIRRVFPM